MGHEIDLTVAYIQHYLKAWDLRFLPKPMSCVPDNRSGMAFAQEAVQSRLSWQTSNVPLYPLENRLREIGELIPIEGELRPNR